MSINAKFQELNQCKADIRQALINKKIDMNGVPFTEYANKVNEIKGGSGNATVDQVLTGATFTNSTGEELIGTMSDNGAVNKTFTPGDTVQTYNIPKGYHNGSGVITCDSNTLVFNNIFQYDSATDLSEANIQIGNANYVLIHIGNFLTADFHYQITNYTGTFESVIETEYQTIHNSRYFRVKVFILKNVKNLNIQKFSKQFSYCQIYKF